MKDAHPAIPDRQPMEHNVIQMSDHRMITDAVKIVTNEEQIKDNAVEVSACASKMSKECIAHSVVTEHLACMKTIKMDALNVSAQEHAHHVLNCPTTGKNCRYRSLIDHMDS